MTSVSKYIYIDKLDDIVNKCSSTYSTIKIKPVDIKSNTYIDSSKEIHDKNPKFKICDNVRISKYKNKRKGDQLYVKWKRCNNLFNSWINEKDSINE